jgi:predicted glycosyltransferase
MAVNSSIIICRYLIKSRVCGGIYIKQSESPEVEKFGDIISELGKRGVVVLMHRPTRWGYVVDAVIPSAKIVILKMPDLTKQVKVAMSQFRDLINRLESDGYQVVVIPKNSMNQEQIKAFCDRIAVEPALAAA